MKRIIRFGVLKMALFMGLYGVFIGLVGGIIFTLGSLTIPEGIPAGDFGAFGFIFGTLAIIFFPIIYGIFGFLGGLIFTPIVNIILKIIHGIDLDMETVENQQPQQSSVQT